MRIGVDARPLWVGRGGIYRYTRALVEALVRVGPSDEVVLFGRPVALALPERVRWSTLWFPGKRWLDQVHLLGASAEIDIFHGTNYYIPLHAGFPRVLTVHDLSVQCLPETHPRLRRLQHRLLPARCRRAARVVVDAPSVKAEALRLLPVSEARLDVVPLAVEERFRPARLPAAERARLRLPGSFLLYVGALEPRKNLPALFEAVAALRGRVPVPPLVIAGAGAPSYEAELRRSATAHGLAIGREVHFLGFVDEADLPLLYAECSVFVYPSRYEGFGLPPLEAMACGVPVVALRSSSLRDLYDETALLVEAGGLADAIGRVLGEPALRDELVARGLRLAGARRWDDVAHDMRRIYALALAEP